MATLTAEQLARIASKKAEADRRLAAYQAQRRAQNSAALPGPETAPAPLAPSGAPNHAVEPQTSSAQQPTNLTGPQRPPMQRPGSVATTGYRPETSAPGHYVAASTNPNPPPASRPQAIITQATEPSTSKTCVIEKVNVSFHLVDSRRFRIHISPYNQHVLSALRELPMKFYDVPTRTWLFPVKNVKLVEEKLCALQRASVELSRLPDSVVKMFGKPTNDVNEKEPVIDGVIDDSLVSSLFPYQRRGVIFGIRRRGRLLLADEMGLGKSIQALGIARYFKMDWPLLIVCPSSVKYTWEQQIKRFLPAVNEISILEKGSDQLPQSRASRPVVIMSYDLMVTKKEDLLHYRFRAIIFDESHLIKDIKAQRTSAATDISREALRVILLTGTPALSRPAELFSQIRIIDKSIFPNFHNFAVRYCDGKQARYGFQAKGCTNSDELSAILLNSVMLRRLKKDVLCDLPAKRQEVVFLSDSTVNENLNNLRKAKAAYNGEKGDKEEKHKRLVEYYYETGIAKAQSVAKHIIENFFYEDAPRRKVLVFAHHSVVLDTLSMSVTKKGLRSIRIDGATSSKSRDEQCRLFQNDEEVRVAILSVTAAGVGVTLTAATVVVFAELHWNPGTLKQAEDRAHRVGQTDSVFIQYLIAKNTADDIMWPLIQKKLDVLGSCKLSSDTYKDAESVEKNVVNTSQGIVEYFPIAKRSRTDEEDKKE